MVNAHQVMKLIQEIKQFCLLLLEDKNEDGNDISFMIIENLKAWIKSCYIFTKCPYN